MPIARLNKDCLAKTAIQQVLSQLYTIDCAHLRHIGCSPLRQEAAQWLLIVSHLTCHLQTQDCAQSVLAFVFDALWSPRHERMANRFIRTRQDPTVCLLAS